MLTEFLAYSQTKEYLHGVFVEMTGTAIEIAVLTISVPIILAVWQRVRTRPLRSLVWHYVFQAFHKHLDIFLDIADVKDIFPILCEEKKKNPEIEIYSHFDYGNLENRITVLHAIIENGSFKKEFLLRTGDDFFCFRDRAKSCLDEIDRLTMMFSSMPNIQEKLFQIRIVFHPLLEIFSTIAKEFGQEEVGLKYHARKLEETCEMFVSIIEAIFQTERKLIDSRWKHRHWCQGALLFLAVLPGFLWECVCTPYFWFKGRKKRKGTAKKKERPQM